LILTGLLSCKSSRHARDHRQDIKLEHIQRVIQKSGFVILPLTFDANINSSLKRNYNVDLKSNDSLIFDKDTYSIVGFLPDTAEYYAILFHTVGDMLYPTIMTIDKKGNKIDRKIICTAGCAGYAALEVTSCYDSVWIYNDLKIKSISKVIGTVDTEDSIPKTIDICNIRKTEGSIDKSGKINLQNSGIIICKN